MYRAEVNTYGRGVNSLNQFLDLTSERLQHNTYRGVKVLNTTSEKDRERDRKNEKEMKRKVLKEFFS